MSRLLSWPTERIEAPVPAVPGPRRLPPPLLARWRKALESWDAPRAAHDALSRLAEQDTPVVVTGQQPGVWGGPLLVLYKAATALALARSAGLKQGREGAVVFWVQGDDADWDEVGWVSVPGPDLAPVRHRWHPSPIPPRGWVGEARLEVPKAPREALLARGVDPLSLEGENADALDLSTRFIRFLLRRFGDRGLLPLDSRWPELREAGLPLWRRYLPRHRELAEAVEARGRVRDAEGKLVPLVGESTERGLFLLEGAARRSVEAADWETEVKAALEEGRGGDLAPSVLLRAILQDHLFAPSAQVVGGTEAAYLDQLRPVFEALEVAPAPRLPRLHATIAPGGLLPPGREAEVLVDPEAWLADRARSRVPEGVQHALRGIRDDLDRGFRAILSAEGGGARDMKQLVDSTRRKVEGQLQRLEEAADRRARRALYAETPALRELPEFLRPRRRPQERGFSGAAFSMILGEAGPSLLDEAAEHHRAALEEGEMHHFLLEGPDV